MVMWTRHSVTLYALLFYYPVFVFQIWKYEIKIMFTDKRKHRGSSQRTEITPVLPAAAYSAEPKFGNTLVPNSRTVESSWNVMAHGRGKWRMEWVASTLHTTSEHGVSSITTADAHTSAASSRLNWRPHRFKWTRSVSLKDEIWFLRVCHHISNAV
jgi:hypothetical protein